MILFRAAFLGANGAEEGSSYDRRKHGPKSQGLGAQIQKATLEAW